MLLAGADEIINDAAHAIGPLRLLASFAHVGRRRVALFVLAGALLSSVSPLQAQDFPARPVHVLVGFAPGSGPDIQARTISQQLVTDLKQAFVVENRMGANGTIAARTVASAPPDGYTLLFSSSSLAPAAHVYKQLGYDTVTDLKAIATSGELDGLLLLVRADSPMRSVADLVSRAKTQRLLYGSPGVGNLLHLTAELFNQKAGIKLDHVPYKGASEVMTGLLTGSIDLMFVTPPSVVGLVQDGRVRPLAFTGSKPFPAFPNVPLLSSEVPGFGRIGSWGMFLAPGRTPDAVVATLNTAIRQALRVPAVSSIVQRDGYMPDDRGPAETQAFLRAEVERMGEVVRAAGIAPN
ncbi:MAG: Bug family tripartite tricarboxylate transporter substrate binding protein [Xanthobacteraceae bacterium]